MLLPSTQRTRRACAPGRRVRMPLQIERGPWELAAPWADRLEPIGRPIRISTRGGEVRGLQARADLVRGLCVEGAGGGSTWVAHHEVLAIDGEGAA